MNRYFLIFLISIIFESKSFAQENENRRHNDICYIATIPSGSLKMIKALFRKNNICIYSYGSSFYAISVDKFNKKRSVILLKRFVKREKIDIKIID